MTEPTATTIVPTAGALNLERYPSEIGYRLVWGVRSLALGVRVEIEQRCRDGRWRPLRDGAPLDDGRWYDDLEAAALVARPWGRPL